jgi:hypothetical protein
MQLVAGGTGEGAASEMTNALAVSTYADGRPDVNPLRAAVANKGPLRADAVHEMSRHEQVQDISKRGRLSLRGETAAC